MGRKSRTLNFFVLRELGAKQRQRACRSFDFTASKSTSPAKVFTFP